MPKKGTTFGGPQAVTKRAPEDEEDEDVEEMDDEDANFSLDALTQALANPYNDLPPVVRRRVDALANLHKSYLSVQKQYQAEVALLEKKYAKAYEPILDKRAAIIGGEYEPTDEEAHVEKPKLEEGEEEPKLREAKPEDAEIKGIPEFWLTVMQNNSLVADSIQEHDEPALEFLRDVRFAELEGDKHGFTLTFRFAENPYFTNTTLVKTYYMEEEELFGELIFEHAVGTKVEWKAGKNLTVKQIKKKVKGKGKGKPPRVVTVEEPQDSFFTFFAPPELNDEAEDAQEVAAVLETDFDIGCTFKDKLIPFSSLWFTGEAVEYDDDYPYDQDEEGEFDDEEDEDDEEEEEEPPRKGKIAGGRGAGHSFNPPAGGKGAPQQPSQPECKQQ